MTYKEIKTAWNAQADDGNRWHSLSEAEKIEWAAIHAAAKARGPAPIFNSAGWLKLESLQRKGFRIVGYALEHCNVLQDTRRCTVDYNGLVRWVPSAEQEVAKERAARQAAQVEVVELKERIARAGVEQRRAVSEAVREAVQAAPVVTSAEQSRELLECVGCGHFYEAPGISACCCGDNPRNEYTKWVAVPTESTPDPRRAADADKAWSLHP